MRSRWLIQRTVRVTPRWPPHAGSARPRTSAVSRSTSPQRIRATAWEAYSRLMVGSLRFESREAGRLCQTRGKRMNLKTLSILVLFGALAGGRAEPIRPHPQNPHYYLFRNRPTVSDHVRGTLWRGDQPGVRLQCLSGRAEVLRAELYAHLSSGVHRAGRHISRWE